MGFWDKKNENRNPFADKALLAKSKAPFRIVNAERKASNKAEYGDWQLVLVCEPATDEMIAITDDMSIVPGATFNIGLGWNAAREHLLEALTETLADGEILTATLYTFEAKGGTTFDIEEYTEVTF